MKKSLKLTLDELIPEFCRSRVLVLGCGNILFGDDGFGPAVIKHFQSHYTVPDDVSVLDVGTGARALLCTIALSPVKPQKIVVVDTIDRGGEPGEVSIVPIEELAPTIVDRPCLHQTPTSSLLKDVHDYSRVSIELITVQPDSIPAVVCPGLSRKVETAIPKACQYIVESCSLTGPGFS